MQAMEPVRSIVHGCIRLESGGKTVYADPYLVEDGAPRADLVIITHSHFDHYSPRDLAKICTEQTRFITNADVAARLAADFGIGQERITQTKAGAPAVTVCGVTVRAVRAVNKNHPEGFGFGAVVDFAGFTYYLSGDTDTLANAGPCDVMFVVCDGVWNMPDYEHAVPRQIAQMKYRPALTVPYHYGAYHPESARNGARLCAALEKAGIPCLEWQG